MSVRFERYLNRNKNVNQQNYQRDLLQYEIESNKIEYDINNNQEQPLTTPKYIERIKQNKESYQDIKMGVLNDYLNQINKLKTRKNELPVDQVEIPTEAKIKMLIHFLSFWNNLQQTEIKNAKKVSSLKATMRKYLISVYSYVLSYINNYTMNFSIIFNNSNCDISIIEKQDQAQDIFFMYLYHEKFGSTKLNDVLLDITDKPLVRIKTINPKIFRMFLFQIDSVILTQLKTLELFAQAIKYNSSIYKNSENNQNFIENNISECVQGLIETDQMNELQIDSENSNMNKQAERNQKDANISDTEQNDIDEIQETVE